MIIGLVGDLGSGKTLTMTKFLYEDFNIRKATIYSNYKLYFKSKLLDNEFMKTFRTINLKNCSIGIDEIHIFLDSRGSQKKSNRLISYFILQTRKRKVDLYYTTQFLNQVDKRLRNITDILIECKCLKNKVTGSMYILNDFHFRSGKRIRKVFDPKPFFNMYNTDEIIGDID